MCSSALWCSLSELLVKRAFERKAFSESQAACSSVCRAQSSIFGDLKTKELVAEWQWCDFISMMIDGRERPTLFIQFHSSLFSLLILHILMLNRLGRECFPLASLIYCVRTLFSLTRPSLPALRFERPFRRKVSKFREKQMRSQCVHATTFVVRFVLRCLLIRPLLSGCVHATMAVFRVWITLLIEQCNRVSALKSTRCSQIHWAPV